MPDGSNFVFDWKKPDYEAIFEQRIQRLNTIRREYDQAALAELKLYYRDNIDDFINDWGVGYDPRNIERGLPAIIPLVLFPKQRVVVKEIVRHWKLSLPLMIDKSRDMGISSICMGLSCALCLFYEGMNVGFGSRKEEYVDQAGSPKSLFFKGRTFMQYLPREFRGNWEAKRDAPHMRIHFRDTHAMIGGEAGDNIGRGDRTALYFVDESAHLERPQLVEASLASTTNCRIDLSSVNGPANPFAVKRHSGKIDVLTFHWRDDPRKDDDWYAKQQRELDPVTLAQEVDINYYASLEGVLIPSVWVNAAVDADLKLKARGIDLKTTGQKRGALDVADEGKDKNAFAGVHGLRVEYVDEWSGKGIDIFESVNRAHGICDDRGYDGFRFDADGLGAGVKGDARKIGEERREASQRALYVEKFLGSGSVIDPGKEDIKDRKNEDTFQNRKAQGWWHLRILFQNTFRAVMEGELPEDMSQMIVLASKMESGPDKAPGSLLSKLIMELAQITYTRADSGKFKIDKAPDGMPSPNMADAIMIAMARGKRSLHINPAVFERLQNEAFLARRLGGRLG